MAPTRSGRDSRWVGCSTVLAGTRAASQQTALRVYEWCRILLLCSLRPPGRFPPCLWPAETALLPSPAAARACPLAPWQVCREASALRAAAARAAAGLAWAKAQCSTRHTRPILGEAPALLGTLLAFALLPPWS